MAVLVAESFFVSVSKLQAKETAKAIDFVTRFQANPKNPGISLERLDGVSKELWSGRITQDLRCILLQVDGDWALLHADHHDAAYRWAERRSAGRHPVTGIIEVVERVEYVEEVRALREQEHDSGTFDTHDDSYLLSLGVPESWLPTLRKVHDEEQLLTVVSRLPQEVAERLLSLATGELVAPPVPVAATQSPINHPDTRRRFFVAEDSQELLRALEAPMEKWLAFLHPTQRALAQATNTGPVKVTGSAGTGKTVVALHRARHLARAGKKVLLTSYVRTLCENLEHALGVLCCASEREMISVSTLHSEALRIVKQIDPKARVASEVNIEFALRQRAQELENAFEWDFIRAEWDGVIQAQGLRTWPEYRTAKRIGRGKPLSTADRKQLWQVFAQVHQQLEAKHEYDWPGICRKAADALQAGTHSSGFDAVIVDEVQDLGRPEILLVAALARTHLENLMVVGDAGQRIYPGGQGLSSMGIDVRGRSKILRLNYRTTEQIRKTADRLLASQCDDLDDGKERRDLTRSILTGPVPRLQGCTTANAERKAICAQIETWTANGILPSEIAIFARTKHGLDAIEDGINNLGLETHRLVDNAAAPSDHIRLGTMHRAKGLEFKAVIVIGCSDRELPNRSAIESYRDPQDREDAEEQERRLLYVAVTRARDELAITWSGKPSRFLEPLL